VVNCALSQSFCKNLLTSPSVSRFYIVFASNAALNSQFSSSLSMSEPIIKTVSKEAG
jgi:hypothetical protein